MEDWVFRGGGYSLGLAPEGGMGQNVVQADGVAQPREQLEMSSPLMSSATSLQVDVHFASN